MNGQRPGNDPDNLLKSSQSRDYISLVELHSKACICVCVCVVELYALEFTVPSYEVFPVIWALVGASYRLLSHTSERVTRGGLFHSTGLCLIEEQVSSKPMSGSRMM